MNATYDKPSRTMTIVFTNAEDRLLTRVKQAVGLKAVEQMLETWLIQQTQVFAERDMVEIKSRLENASAVELDAVKTALNM